MALFRLLALLVLTLVPPAAARAQDACLTGDSLLGDQRALAALRAATDAACPCASFTGGKGKNRGAYQKCAKAALAAAVGSAALRRECEKTAAAVNKGAVCGSGKVACGRHHPNAKHPISCRLKKAAACHDGRRFKETACTQQTHCQDVIDWTAGTCVDARRSGPFAAGARVIPFTKPSAVNPMNQRTLNTVVWYPAPAGSGPVNTSFRAVENAPLDMSGGPYPLVVFSHGSCGFERQSLFMTPLLASHGFIVVAPPHPGNTIFDFPNCGTATAQASSFIERPQDVEHVLDQMLAADGDPASPFFGAIDETRLGMSGHSFGGLTTYLVAQIDTRFSAFLPMAPAALVNPIVTAPQMAMLGQVDSVVNNPATRTAWADDETPKYLAEIRNAGHFAFSDLCFPNHPDCAQPAKLTQAEAHDQVNRWVLPFLKVHVAGDQAFAPFLLPQTTPGTVVESRP